MKTLLVPVDFSDASAAVLAAAGKLARAFSARVVLLHVAPPDPAFIGYEPGPQTVRDSVARELAAEHRSLQALEKELADTGVSVTALVIQGYPAEKIVAEAAKLSADLIVMGSHGRGMLKHLLVGSVTEGVLRHAACPVMVVPHRR